MDSLTNSLTGKEVKIEVAKLSDGCGGRTIDSTPNNLTIIVDPEVPKEWYPMFAIHEAVEAREMEDGKSYYAAHKIATEAEREYCNKNDIDFDKYDREYLALLKKIEARSPKPKDPDDIFYGTKPGAIQKSYSSDRIKHENKYIKRLKQAFLASVALTAKKTKWPKVKTVDDIAWSDYDALSELSEVYEGIGDILANHLEIEWEPSRVKEWLREYGGEEIKYLSDSSRSAIRQALADYAEDIGTESLGDKIKPFLGLDPRRADALQGYLKDLAEKDPTTDIMQAAKEYGDELLTNRADLIANNEVLTASRQASNDLVDDAVTNGDIDPDKYVGVWLTIADQPGQGDDGHICEFCQDANGSIRELPDGVYEANGEETPDGHVGCRCIESIELRSEVEKGIDVSDVRVPMPLKNKSQAYLPNDKSTKKEGDSIPYKPCTLKGGGKGTKYGDSGKCYADKKDAEAQAQAIHAAGFVEKDKDKEPDNEDEDEDVEIDKDDECVADKIKEEMDKGHEQDQAIAIAYSECDGATSKKSVKKDDNEDNEDESEESPDKENAEEMLEDEEKGKEEYEEAAEEADCPKLKAIFTEHAADEARHADDLKGWLDGNAEFKKYIAKCDLGTTKEYYKAVHDYFMSHPNVLPAHKDEAFRKSRAIAGGFLKGRKTKDKDKPQEPLIATNVELDQDAETQKCSGMTVSKFEKFMPIIKIDEDEQKAFCVVNQPGFDLQGDYSTEKEIEKAAHKFMENISRSCSRGIGLNHQKPIDASIIENVVTRQEGIKLGDQVLRKGTWYQGHKVNDPEVWKAIKSGEITGLSRQGHGVRVPIMGDVLAKAIDVAKSANVIEKSLNYLLDEDLERIDWVRKGANGQRIAIFKQLTNEVLKMSDAEPKEGSNKSEPVTAAQIISKADLEQIRKEIEEATEKKYSERIKKAETIAKEERDLRITREFLEKAKHFKHIPGIKMESFGLVLKEIAEKVEPDTFKQLENVLKSTEEALSVNDITKEIGSDAPMSGKTTATEQIQVLTKAKLPDVMKSVTDPRLAEAQAMIQVRTENPELWKQYTQEVALR